MVMSRWHPVTSGVLQDSILQPLLSKVLDTGLEGVLSLQTKLNWKEMIPLWVKRPYREILTN